VAICGLQGLLAATLPVFAACPAAQPRLPTRRDERAASRYVAMLRAGLSESRHHPDVRRVLLARVRDGRADDVRRVLPPRRAGPWSRDLDRATAPRRGRGRPGRRHRCGRSQCPARLPGHRGVPGGGSRAGVDRRARHAVRRVRGDRGRLRPRQQRDARGETRLQDTITGPARATVDECPRPARGGRRPDHLRGLRSRFPTARVPDPGRTAGTADPVHSPRRSRTGYPLRGGVARITRTADLRHKPEVEAVRSSGGREREAARDGTSRSQIWPWPTSVAPRSPSPSTRCPA